MLAVLTVTPRACSLGRGPPRSGPIPLSSSARWQRDTFSQTNKTERQNRLNKAEYELTTCAARTWLSFSTQKMSVALHRAAALEIAHAIGLSTGADER